MNKQQLYTAGSVLLATTALTGAANAATLQGGFTANTQRTATALTTVNVANTVFSTTASTANGVTVGPANIFMAFSNAFTAATKFSIELTPVGAGMTQTVDAHLVLGAAGGSFVGLGSNWTVAASTACTSITPLTTKIILDGCGGLTVKVSATNGAGADTSASYAGVIFSGVSFNNASGLASVGGTIGLSGIIYNANNATQQFETLSATNIIGSIAPISASIVSGGTATANASATPVAFAYFATGGAVGAGSVLTATLAVVDISSTGAFAANLTTQVVPEAASGSAAQAISSIQVTVTSSMLSQAAVQAVSINNSTAGTQNATISNFSAGVATFSINSNSGFTSFSISVAFSGTTALSAASAGTVAINFGVGGSVPTGQAVPAISGKTASLSLGGFNAELNTFLGSSNTSFSSFARIHNNGIIAGVATVTVRNDATGVTMGTYTTASIATSQTLQISAKDIETGAGITAAAGLNYTLSIAGAFSGYAQHIIFNPATGQLADLSAFRNKGTPTGTTAP